MFANCLSTGELRFKHAMGCRNAVGKEFHVFHELFLLLGDCVTFTSDRIISKMHPCSLAIIPGNQFHQFDLEGTEEDYHRYVLQFDRVEGLDGLIAEVFDRVKLIHSLRHRTLELFGRLESLLRENMQEQDKALMLKAVFTEILLDLKYNYRDALVTEQLSDRILQQVVEYIHKNYLGEITVSSLAKSLNFSETYISHRFKEIMHISIYKYILQKKLVHAHRLITAGTPAVAAAEQCGFREYSGFYKMFKKHFGYSPSKAKRGEHHGRFAEDR